MADEALGGSGPAGERAAAWEVVRGIFSAWRHGRPEEMRPFLHDDMVMVFFQSGERAIGADAVLEGFVAFSATAVTEHMEARERQVDVVGNTAVASYAYALSYLRDGRQFHATGRDLWVLQKSAGQWRAAWRTMLELEERERR